MNISGWQQQEVLLSSDNSVEILIVILVEGGLRVLCTNPEVNSFRRGAESFGGPTDMGVTVTGEGRVFRAKAIVLLLGIGHKLGGVGGGDEVEGVGEGHVLHVSRGEAEGGGGVGSEGVGGAGGGEVEGDGGGGEGLGEVGGVGPGRECWPVGDGVGDDAGFVWVDEVSEELE